jgi:hypothetical protein
MPIVDPHTRDAPETPPEGTVRGPKSCVLAALITGVLGFGSIGLAKWMVERRNADLIGATKEFTELIERAGTAPGAAALAADGCEEAIVLGVDDLKKIAQPLADARASQRSKTPQSIDLRTGEDPVVVCATKAELTPDCAKVASTYTKSASPKAPYVVTVQSPKGESCSERFDAAGSSLGTVKNPNVPMLVQPR